MKNDKETLPKKVYIVDLGFIIAETPHLISEALVPQDPWR